MGSVVRIKNMTGFEYYIIEDIIVYQGHKILEIIQLDVCGFDEHLQAYLIKVTEFKRFCSFDNLFCHGVLHIKEKHHKLYLIERDNQGKFNFLLTNLIHTCIRI